MREYRPSPHPGRAALPTEARPRTAAGAARREAEGVIDKLTDIAQGYSPSTSWDSSLVGILAVNTRSATYTNLSAILTAAVDDGLLAVNPCSAKS